MIRGKRGFWRFFLLVILIILIAVLVVFGARIWLFFKFLLGNDVLMTINSDKNEIILQHGEMGEINFDVKVTANLFCTVKCNTRLRDIGTNAILKEETSTSKLGVPVHRSYTINTKEFGEGEDWYRFEIECIGEQTYLCDTGGEAKSRNSLFRVVYNLTEEEQKIKDEGKIKINEIITRIEKENASIELFESALEKINNSFSTEEFYGELYFAKANLNLKIEQLKGIKASWNIQDYNSVDKNLNSLEKNYTIFNLFNSSFYRNISLYNNLVRNMSSAKLTLEKFKNENISLTSSQEINNLILEFNNATIFFSKKNQIEAKRLVVNNISDKINNTVLNFSNQCCFAKEIINDFNLSEISLVESANISKINILFENPKMQCCVFGKCEDCCITEECMSNKTNFPILFIHGHDFSGSVPADYSLDGFNTLLRSLEKDENYLNTGEISLKNLYDTPSGFFSKINNPTMIRVSYYFDVLKTGGVYTSIQAKSESIDTYALRLNEIITEVKRKTGKPKVVLVTHSMGGLVARKYMDIFGTENVEKAIIITAPNHGVYGKVAQLCSIFGESAECSDMKSDSLFLNKLNNAPIPNISIYNIVGVGCSMDLGDGDGIVLEKSAEIEGVGNILFTGSCSTVRLFHTEILDSNKYPEVYNTIKELLKS